MLDLLGAVSRDRTEKELSFLRNIGISAKQYRDRTFRGDETLYLFRNHPGVDCLITKYNDKDISVVSNAFKGSDLLDVAEIPEHVKLDIRYIASLLRNNEQVYIRITSTKSTDLTKTTKSYRLILKALNQEELTRLKITLYGARNIKDGSLTINDIVRRCEGGLKPNLPELFIVKDKVKFAHLLSLTSVTITYGFFLYFNDDTFFNSEMKRPYSVRGKAKHERVDTPWGQT